MSEREREDRLTGREITIEDVRALAGPATPHFALQIRNRIARLIEPLPPATPPSSRASEQIERLTELADALGRAKARHLSNSRQAYPEARPHCSEP